MNTETFISFMPIEVVKEEEVNKKIEEQKQLSQNGKAFVSRLSINRYLYKNLADFDINERVNLFSVLSEFAFFYNENGLYFGDLDIDTFCCVLEENFNLANENMYELDQLYVENLLKGKDLTEEVITIYEGKSLSFKEMLEQFVFSTSGMPVGDTPNLMLMLVVKKALLGSYFAEKNAEALAEGKREIYKISSLF